MRNKETDRDPYSGDVAFPPFYRLSCSVSKQFTTYYSGTCEDGSVTADNSMRFGRTRLADGGYTTNGYAGTCSPKCDK